MVHVQATANNLPAGRIQHKGYSIKKCGVGEDPLPLKKSWGGGGSTKNWFKRIDFWLILRIRGWGGLQKKKNQGAVGSDREEGVFPRPLFFNGIALMMGSHQPQVASFQLICCSFSLLPIDLNFTLDNINNRKEELKEPWVIN